MKLSQKWIEKIYAGWLAKIIGIRLGAPVEGWTHEEIKDIYGDKEGYLVDYKRFAGTMTAMALFSFCGRWRIAGNLLRK